MKSSGVWQGRRALTAGLLALTVLAIGPAGAQAADDWRRLCSPGNEVEILIGSSWYRGTVVGPNTFGEAECGVLNTSYSGREMQFAMAPDRMRPVSAPQSPASPMAPASPAEQPWQAAWQELCLPGGAVEILIGNSWYQGTVVGPNTFGEAECGVLNTTYSGREMQFAMAPDRMRAMQPPGGTDIAVAGAQQQGPDAGALLDVQVGEPAPARYQARLDGRPPLGRYVCRQYVTTIGWIDLAESTYAVNDVQGGYAFDPASGAVAFAGGAYAGWPARYEFSPAGAGHAHDENIIRITDETGALKIDCFLTE